MQLHNKQYYVASSSSYGIHIIVAFGASRQKKSQAGVGIDLAQTLVKRGYTGRSSPSLGASRPVTYSAASASVQSIA
jgi:hypothetical protein